MPPRQIKNTIPVLSVRRLRPETDAAKRFSGEQIRLLARALHG
ncbi:MAG: hypothetical protein R2856_24090 [Caldilineaceae bacterium]